MKRLLVFKAAHAKQLINWFANQQELIQWAGKGITFTQKIEHLVKYLNAQPLGDGKIQSFSLMQGDQLIAFGQYYQRLDCCHLCRLAVAPEHRGKGLVSELISEILAIAYKELELSSASLFVYSSNSSALIAYQKLGFSVAEYRGNDDINDCLYMRREN